MAAELKVVGKAVALKRGHYQGLDGRWRIITEGEQFDLVEGKTTATWFKALPQEKKVPKGSDIA